MEEASQTPQTESCYWGARTRTGIADSKGQRLAFSRLPNLGSTSLNRFPYSSVARVTLPRPDGAEGMPDIIIPRKCVAELRKLLDEIDGSVGVSLSSSKIRFDMGQALLTSKLIDGTFPDYSRVIPTGNDKILRIDPRSFEEGVDRVSTIATEKTRAVKMTLDRDKITLSVTSPENGTAAEEVPGDYAAQGFDIGFNSRYLLDILGQIEGDMVEVHLADASAPTLIRENDKSPALYVLMPMRV